MNMHPTVFSIPWQINRSHPRPSRAHLGAALIVITAFITAFIMALLIFATPQNALANTSNSTNDETLTAGSSAESTPTVMVKVNVKGKGWMKAVGDGETAGTRTKKGIRSIKVSLSNTTLSGAVKYRTHQKNKKWTKYATNGSKTPNAKKLVDGVRISLTGQISKAYNVYYRVFVKGYGWLDWAKNGKIAGTFKESKHISALQVKLVEKGQAAPGLTKTPRIKNKWAGLEFKYRDNDDVNEILEVKYKGGSKANVVLRRKAGLKWKTLLSCKGYVGKEGIGKAREGLSRTPKGDFEITEAFGIKSDPGALLEYVKVDSSMYWCSDREYYNQLIDIDECPHDCTGEHLIDVKPHYNYGLFFDYNTNPVRYGAGSAFFVHCSAGSTWTEGCIGVSQKNMIKIIRKVSSGARLCIFNK